MPWNLIKPYLIGAGIAFFLTVTASAYFTGRITGKASTETQVVKQQVKTLQKVAKQNEKIDRNTPFNGDKRDALDWLFKYTRKAD